MIFFSTSRFLPDRPAKKAIGACTPSTRVSVIHCKLYRRGGVDRARCASLGWFSSVGISLKRGPAQRHFDFALLAATIDNDNPRRRTRSTPRLILPVIRYNGFQARVRPAKALHSSRRQCRLGKSLTQSQSWFLR